MCGAGPVPALACVGGNTSRRGARSGQTGQRGHPPALPRVDQGPSTGPECAGRRERAQESQWRKNIASNLAVSFYSSLSFSLQSLSTACDKGEGWQLVRGAPMYGENRWFKAEDNLAGTEEYGDINVLEEQFSVKFDNIEYDQASYLLNMFKIYVPQLTIGNGSSKYLPEIV